MVALACLALLLGSILGGLDIWARLSPASLPFDWRLYRDTIRADPSAGWALYLMVLTTLLPTAIHVVAGLGALLTHKSRLRRRVADRLQAALTVSADLIVRERGELVSQIHRASLWGYGAALFVTVPLTLAVLFVILRLIGGVLGP